MTINERIQKDIFDATCSIFVKYQDELGITSGDEDVLLALEYEQLEDKMIDYFVKTLTFQCWTNHVDMDKANKVFLGE